MPEVVIGKDVETGDLITIGDRERGGGFYILGKPRTGKSHLMISMALQDMAHDHPVLFIDPHTDAITAIMNHLPLKRQQHVILLDPTDKNYSFGLNPLHCKDPHDPLEQDRTYGRVQDIFIKLWPNEQGRLSIWMEKILQNAVYALLENPGYTLVDIPLLLSPDTTFRNALLKNVTVNPYVKDFWFEEFDRLSPSDRRREVEPVLSRLNTFRTNATLRHILGQSRSTIDFHAILNTSPTPYIVLLRMPDSLPENVRSAIGTMVISEMLAATFDRDQLPESERRLFAVYCDEFQLFTTPDFAKLITQTGKFYLMPHVAHQVRDGQLKPDDPNTGATLAAPHIALFGLSITDSPKVAPLMAKRVEATEKRREAELVLSPRPVEDLWERGHPSGAVMDVRGTYFWIVEDLRNTPNEKYFKFDPLRMPPQYRRENPLTFQMQEYDDWEIYCSSAEMLRRGIALLNQYYYDWMGKRYEPDQPLTDAQVELTITVIECFGGVLGFLPMLRPVLTDAKRARLTYTMTEKLRQTHEQEKRNKVQELKDQLEYRFPPLPGPMLPPVPFGYRLTQREQTERDKMWQFEAESDARYYGKRKKFQDQIFALEQSVPPAAPSLPQTLSSPTHIREVQTMAIQAGMATSEVEQLIEWEARPLERPEKDALAAMMTRARALTLAFESLKFYEQSSLDFMPFEQRRYSTRFSQGATRYIRYQLVVKNLQRRSRTHQLEDCYFFPDGRPMEWEHYEWPFKADSDREGFRGGRGWPEPGHWQPGTYRVEILIDREKFAEGSFTIADEGHPVASPVTHEPEDVQEGYGLQCAALSQRLCPPGLPAEKASRRLIWQMAELKQFINACFRDMPRLLMQEPLKVPSGKYDETLTVERLQNDLIAEMGLELSRLSPHTAYVHVVQEQDGVQVVRQAKIRTLPHDPPHSESLEEAIKEHSHAVAYKARTAIEAEIRQRQERWRRSGDRATPPPTHMEDTTQQALPPQRTLTEREAPPPSHVTPGEPHQSTPAVACESLRFYESGDESIEPKTRQYRTHFPQRATRYMNFELTVKHFPQDRDQTHTVTFRYYQPDGSLLDEGKGDWVISAGGDLRSYACGWGWKEPGHWRPGTYRVEILLDGKPFAEGPFTID